MPGVVLIEPGEALGGGVTAPKAVKRLPDFLVAISRPEDGPLVSLVFLGGHFDEGLVVDLVKAILPFKAFIAAGGEVGEQVSGVAGALVVFSTQYRIPVPVVPVLSRQDEKFVIRLTQSPI